MTPREIAKRLENESGGVDFLAVIEKGTQLSVLSRNLGTTALTKNIVLLITDFANSFNVFTPMNDDQIMDLAEEFAVEWWEYTLEDFVCFFQRAKKSDFHRITETSEKYYSEAQGWKTKKKIVDHGPIRITNRVDRGIILEMLEAYDRERTEAIFQREAAPNQSISKDRLNAEFSLGDLAPMLRGEMTLDEILEAKRTGGVVGNPEKKNPEPAIPDAIRAAEILEIQLKTFVDDIIGMNLSRAKWMLLPFSRGREELIVAELERRKKADNGGN